MVAAFIGTIMLKFDNITRQENNYSNLVLRLSIGEPIAFVSLKSRLLPCINLMHIGK